MTDPLQRGFDAYQAGRFGDAEAAYREALKISPDHPEALMHLGVVLRRLGRLDEAVDCLQRAAEVAPGEFRNFANLAVALQSAHRLEDAIDAYGQAYRLEPRAIRQITVSLATGCTGAVFLDPRRLEERLSAKPA